MLPLARKRHKKYFLAQHQIRSWIEIRIRLRILKPDPGIRILENWTGSATLVYVTLLQYI